MDEFTGRLMPGRRWSDGLHQAVEAKEGVKVEPENVTYATITLQNYFRMYAKLAGMTGTALTEAEEFDKIYKLDVLPIPTNLEYQAFGPEVASGRGEGQGRGRLRVQLLRPPRRSRKGDRSSGGARTFPTSVYRTEEAKLRAIVRRDLPSITSRGGPCWSARPRSRSRSACPAGCAPSRSAA